MKSFLFLIILSAAIFYTGCSSNEPGDRINGTGTIETTTSIVSSKVAGTIEKIEGVEGVFYNAGDTLITIEHDILDLNYKQALAATDAAKSKFDLLKTGAREEDIRMAEEQLNQAEINLDLANEDNDRMAALYEEKAITKKQFDDVNARYRAAESQHEIAEKNLQKLKNFARKEDLEYASAMLNQAKANLALIKKNIDNCYITAPFSGTLLKTLVELGENAAPGTSLIKFSDTRKAELVIYVSETELGYVKPGQKAEISIDSFSDKKFNGTVTYISSEAEFTPKNIQTKDERTKLVYGIKIEIPNPDNELKSGMPADAEIIVHATK